MAATSSVFKSLNHCFTTTTTASAISVFENGTYDFKFKLILIYLGLPRVSCKYWKSVMFYQIIEKSFVGSFLTSVTLSTDRLGPCLQVIFSYLSALHPFGLSNHRLGRVLGCVSSAEIHACSSPYSRGLHWKCKSWQLTSHKDYS